MADHTITITTEAKLKQCILRQLPGIRYVLDTMDISLSIFPQVTKLISGATDCNFESNGVGSFEVVSFKSCVFEGSVNLYGCSLEDCKIYPTGRGVENIAILGGSLKNVKIFNEWQTLNFGPNSTENVTFADDFWALETIPRIACASWGGVKMDVGLIAKLLAGLCYDQEIVVPSKELVEKMTVELRKRAEAE